ncbi:hypothetical protein [Streptomyces sp. NPDC058457]
MREARLIGSVVLLGIGADFLDPVGLRRPDLLDMSSYASPAT